MDSGARSLRQIEGLAFAKTVSGQPCRMTRHADMYGVPAWHCDRDALVIDTTNFANKRTVRGSGSDVFDNTPDRRLFSLILQFPEAAPQWRERPDRRVAVLDCFPFTIPYAGHCPRRRIENSCALS